MQIRGTGLILGTEFTDNKSPNDPFPPEWGKFNFPFSFSHFLFVIYLAEKIPFSSLTYD